MKQTTPVYTCAPNMLRFIIIYTYFISLEPWLLSIDFFIDKIIDQIRQKNRVQINFI